MFHSSSLIRDGAVNTSFVKDSEYGKLPGLEMNYLPRTAILKVIWFILYSLFLRKIYSTIPRRIVIPVHCSTYISGVMK